MDHVCQECGAINEDVELREREVVRTGFAIPFSSTADLDFEDISVNVSTEPMEIPTFEVREVFWKCRACGHEHVIDTEELKEDEE